MYTRREADYICDRLKPFSSIMMIGLGNNDVPLIDICSSAIKADIYIINNPLYGNWDDWVGETIKLIEDAGGRRPIPIKKSARDFSMSFHEQIDALVLTGAYHDFTLALMLWIIHVKNNGDIFIFDYKCSPFVTEFIDRIVQNNSNNFIKEYETANMVHFSIKKWRNDE
jgi:hypothetical protein